MDPYTAHLQQEVIRLRTEVQTIRDQRDTLSEMLPDVIRERDELSDLVNLNAAAAVALEAQLKARTAERDKLGEALTDMTEEKEMAEAELEDLEDAKRRTITVFFPPDDEDE